MKRLILFLFSMSLLAATPASADETVSVKIGFMSLDASGQFASTTGGVGTVVDMKQDLGFTRSNNVTGEIALQFGDSRISAGYMPLSFSGAGTLAVPVTFNGQTFNTAVPVSSSVKADIFDLAYTYYLVNMDDLPSRLQLGVELAVKITRADLSMSGGGVGATQSVSGTAPIPTIGLRGRVALADFLGLSGRIGYLGYAGNRFMDADIQVEFSPMPALGVYGGYRQLDIKLDSSGVLLDTRFSGPYAGVFFRF